MWKEIIINAIKQSWADRNWAILGLTLIIIAAMANTAHSQSLYSYSEKTQNGLTVGINPISISENSDVKTYCYWAKAPITFSSAPTLSKTAFQFSKAANISGITTKITERKLVMKTYNITYENCTSNDEEKTDCKNITEEITDSWYEYPTKTAGSEVIYCFDKAVERDKDGHIQLTPYYFNFSLAGAKADPDISVCTNLSTPNTVYDLTASSWGMAQTCFNITAANITLDGHGFYIEGDNATAHYGINITSAATNFTVKNLGIRNFSVGIYALANILTITNNTINITHKTSCSVSTTRCVGIYMESANYTNISNNSIYVYQYGIALRSNSNFATIEWNQINATNMQALYLGSDGNHVVQFNNISSATSSSTGNVYLTVSYNNTFNYNNISGAARLVSTATSGGWNNFTNNNFTSTYSSTAISGTYAFTQFINNTFNTTAAAISFYGANSDNQTFINNTIYSADDSITLGGSGGTKNITVYNNWIKQAGSFTFASTGAQFCNVSNNNITDFSTVATDAALYFSGAAAHNYIANNIVNKSVLDAASTGYAFRFETSNPFNNTFINNTFDSNRSSTTTGSMVFSTGGNNNTFQNNTIISRSIAPAISGYPSNNTFYENAISATLGIGIRMSAASYNNSFVRNNITALNWILDLNESSTDANHTTNNYNDSTSGNIYYFANGTGSWQVFQVINDGTSNWGQTGSGVPHNFTTVSSNISGAGQPNDWHPYNNNLSSGAPPTSGNCSVLSTPNSIYTMAENIWGVSNTCFNITGANITLNCAGYQLNGTNTSDNIAINSTAFNTTIKNCIISNFSNAIRIYGDTADFANITNNTINLTYSLVCTTAVGTCNGVFLAYGDNASITENRIYTHAYGIDLYNGAKEALIAYNNVTEEDDYGIFLTTDTDRNNITGNNITVAEDKALMLYVGAYGNRIANNTITADRYAVFLDTYVDNNIITNNNITASSYGAYFSAASNNTLQDNLIDSGSIGIFMADASNNNATNNTVNVQADKAVYLYSNSMNNTFTNNTLWASISIPVFEAINITAGSGNNTFILNTIYGEKWVVDSNVSASGYSTNKFNDSARGNIYYWNNGTGAWEVFNILCTGATPCWANAGSQRPLNHTFAGDTWAEYGEDWFPYSNNASSATTCTPPAINNDWNLNMADNCVCSSTHINIGTGIIYYYGNGGYTANACTIRAKWIRKQAGDSGTSQIFKINVSTNVSLTG